MKAIIIIELLGHKFKWVSFDIMDQHIHQNCIIFKGLSDTSSIDNLDMRELANSLKS